MAEYTIELGTLLQHGFHLALDDYPIFNPAYRNVLNNKIIEHFYFREIGLETPDRFNFFLRRTMNEIMPYYNKLYNSELSNFDPFQTDFYSEATNSYTSAQKLLEQIIKNAASETTGDRLAKQFGNSEEYSETSGQDVTGNTSSNGTSVTDTTTSNTEDETTNTTSNSTRDLTQNTTTEEEAHGTGENHTTGNKQTNFSDDPQTQLTTTTTIAPDGTTTIVSEGYLTTQTTETTSQNDNTTTDQNSNGETDTTANEKIDSTQNTTRDLKADGTSNSETTTHNSGTSSSNTKGNRETSSSRSDNEDSQRNIDRNSNAYETHFDKDVNESAMKGDKRFMGRRGYSPSQLLQQYRETFLNIDMMIIADLEKLFMGVY